MGCFLNREHNFSDDLNPKEYKKGQQQHEPPGGQPVQNVAYIQVSSVDQKTDRQDFPGIEKDRPGLAACLSHLRESDTLHVHSIDRLARD